jgi:hypothetical protein
MVCCGYFKVSEEGLTYIFQDIKLSVDVDIWPFLATSSLNWAKFYSILWSHCLPGTITLAYKKN